MMVMWKTLDSDYEPFYYGPFTTMEACDFVMKYEDDRFRQLRIIPLLPAD